MNDVETLCETIRSAADPAPLILVDAISGLGAIRLPMDAWGVDVVVSGSQKAWMAPPGLAFIGFSDRAWQAYETAKMPRHYFDLGLARRYLERGQVPTTPGMSALYGLQVSIRRLVAEGVQAVEERHRRIGAHCRARALDLGLGLYADAQHYSNTVTAVTLNPGMDPTEVLERLRVEYDIIVGASKDPNVDMIRIGHMGYVTEAEIDQVFDALAKIMAG
jgi:aspartate aminotransferase-like enzyme